MTARERFDDLASRYLDDALEPAELDEFGARLASDPTWARRFVALARLHATLRHLHAAGLAGRARARRISPASLGLAAALLLVLVLLLRPAPLAGGPSPAVPGGAEVLFVVGRPELDLTPGDRLVRDRLARLGFRVRVATEDRISEARPASARLVVVSESVRSDLVGADLASVPVPILNCEPNLSPALGLAGRPGAAGDHFAKTYRFRVRIVAPDHPLAAGLRGRVRIYERPGTVGWAPPAASAAVVAVSDDAPEQATIFACEAAARDPAGSPPARRAAFFLSDREHEATFLTPEGWTLFEAAVRWLAEP